MPAQDLTTLASLKAWLGNTSANDDRLLTALIRQVSRGMLAVMSRSGVLAADYTEIRDGRGGSRLMLAEWPVLSVSSLKVNGAAIVQTSWAANGTPGPGYLAPSAGRMPPGSPQCLDFYGGCFAHGQQNVAVSYRAGYQLLEPVTIPAGKSITVEAPYGFWRQDDGVTRADGTTLVKVASSPAVGQYAFGGLAGEYAFADADVGAAIVIAYSYVPAELEEACIEQAAERYRYKERIGMVTKSLGGQETASYSLKDMPDWVRLLLQQYARVVPLD